MIKEQLKQENQRKLFDKPLFITIFNSITVVLLRLSRSFYSSFYSFFGCSGGFVSVFRWFRCFRFGVSVVSFRCFGDSGGFVPVVSFRCFSTCPLNVPKLLWIMQL